MDTFEAGRLFALILQLIGITVGAGLIFERVIKADLLGSLFVTLNIFQKTALSRPLYIYKVSDNIDELYEEASRPILILLPLLLVTIILAFSLGLWLLLSYRLYQFSAYDISITKSFWIIFSIWFFALAISYALTVPMQLELLSRQSGKTSSFSDGLVEFVKSWYIYPWQFIRIAVLLCIVVILLLPAWVSRIDVSFEKQRQRYYLTYATIALLLSILFQIMLIVIR